MRSIPFFVLSVFTDYSSISYCLYWIINDHLSVLFASNSTHIHGIWMWISPISELLMIIQLWKCIRARLNATNQIYLPFESNGTVGVKILPRTGISSILCSGPFLLFFVGELSKASMLKSVAMSLRWTKHFFQRTRSFLLYRISNISYRYSSVVQDNFQKRQSVGFAHIYRV